MHRLEMSKRTSLAQRADRDRGGVKMGVAPVLLLSGLVGLWSCLNGAPPIETTGWWTGTVGWWVKFTIGLVSVCAAGAFWSGGRWERAAAILRDELSR